MKRLALAIGAAASLAVSSAAAQDIPRELRLDVQEDRCITAERLREALAVVHGADLVQPTAPARLRVRAAAGSSLGRARWEVLDGQGVLIRKATVTVAGDCGDLLRNLALSIVIAYETDAPPPPPPVGCDAACRAAVRAEVRADLLAEGYRAPMDVNVAVMAGGLLSLGYTADPGPGMFVAGELHGAMFSGALEARVLFPSRIVSEPTKYAFDVTAVTAAFVPCARWKVLLGCAFVDVGALFASVPITVPFTGPVVAATLGFGPRLAVHLPFADRFAARLFADLRFAPVPSSFMAADTGSRWESNVVSGLFGAALVFE